MTYRVVASGLSVFFASAHEAVPALIEAARHRGYATLWARVSGGGFECIAYEGRVAQGRT